MKKSFSLLLATISFIFFLSCSNNDEILIKQTIQEYQTALNNNNTEKLIELSENPDNYTISLASQYLNMFTEIGLKPEFTIDIIELKINDNIAETRLKTTTRYIGDDKDAISAMSYLVPPVTDSIMTLKKVNDTWKILTEKDIE